MNDLSTDMAAWTRRDLLDCESLSPAEIQLIHRLALQCKRGFTMRRRKLPTLRGATILNLFVEPSTRTRVAFELAAKNLGADVSLMERSASSLVKGESLRDTGLTVEALGVDAVVLRHSKPGAPHYLANEIGIPVINAGDGAHEHPTQALLDTFTLLEHWDSLAGKRITILGDILFSRVARSNVWAMTKLGAEVTLAGPSTLVPEALAEAFPGAPVRVTHDLRTALDGADAVMLLRIQHERQTRSHFPSLGEYTKKFGLNAPRAEWMKPDALIMHPGPMNRGVEITPDLADGERSTILAQVTNGIAVRMAVLALCLSAHFAAQKR